MGYRILDRNWRSGRNGELDIVAWHAQSLVFVEVKTRTLSTRSFPENRWVSKAKEKQIAKLARRYRSAERRKLRELTIRHHRFDLVTVSFQRGEPQIRHLEAAFGAHW